MIKEKKLKCLFGHKWLLIEGECVKICSNCGKEYIREHQFADKGCICKNCFTTIHIWKGCKCERCGDTRDQGHDYYYTDEEKICRKCGIKYLTKSYRCEHDFVFYKFDIGKGLSPAKNLFKCSICGEVKSEDFETWENRS